jgi:hypothetical protein
VAGAVPQVRALASLNRKMLEAFSRRTVDALRVHLPLRLVLPHLERILAPNVEKEVRKDTLVIHRAGAALASAAAPGPEIIAQLLDASMEIDRLFLQEVARFPVKIVIRYDEIAPVRRQRIERLFEASFRILGACRDETDLRRAIRSCYSPQDLDALLRAVLRQYALEIDSLSRSVKLPALLSPARRVLMQKLSGVMNGVATQFARELTELVYRPRHRGPA